MDNSGAEKYLEKIERTWRFTGEMKMGKSVRFGIVG